MQQKFNSLFLMGALLLVANSANAASVYDNNISALNINMLTDVFMSYTKYGEKMSDLFEHRIMYGTMDRFDEYGDDGSTVKNFDSKNEAKSDSFISDMWINANHINADMHYGNNLSQRGKFNLATVGATTRDIDLERGKISFGGFVSYINTKENNSHANGDVVGIFSNYKFRNFGAKVLLDTGALNNSTENMKFNNSWVNAGADAYAILKIDETFFVRPEVYIAYTFVNSDDLYINGNAVRSENYNFFNVAPELTFIKEVSKNWYGALSAKYVAHMGGTNDIVINDVAVKGLDLDNYTDVGIDVEHNYKQFVFGAKVHKQIGGIDGLSANINIKYAF